MSNLVEKKKKRKIKKSYQYSSKTITTGDIGYNISQFNKHMGTDFPGNDNNNPSTVEAGGVGNGGDGGGMGESLAVNEEKRYVRRYFIRPQNLFASNKDEVLKALIDHQDENCTVYSLNSLADNDDVTKLSSNDVIYYYEDGILYDKNHVRIMDYDLKIKHEEEREKVNPEAISDARFADIYNDRMTDATDTDESLNVFTLNFPDIDASGKNLSEAFDPTICCICGEELAGAGNSPEPYKAAENGKCCAACYVKFVQPLEVN